MPARIAISLVLVFAAVGLSGCGMFGPSPDEQVEMAFDPDDPDKRREGVGMLSDHEWGLGKEYLDGYVMMLKQDQDPSVRAAAVRALGKAEDPKYLPEIVGALSDESASVRFEAAVVLDQTPGPIAVEPLQIHALTDPSVDVRMWCAKALRHYRKEEVVGTLVRCLSDSSFDVCYYARKALVELTGRDYGYEPGDWPKITEAELAAVPVKSKKRWWDWFGVARRDKSPPRHRKKPVEVSAPGKGTGKPWWDWFGVTRKDKDSQSKPKALAPAPPKPRTSERPWWDWFGVSRKEKAPGAAREKPVKAVKADSAEKRGGRPWWDLLGITVKKEPAPEKPKQEVQGSTTPSGRPWWDWFGVTRKEKPSGSKSKTSVEADPGAGKN